MSYGTAARTGIEPSTGPVALGTGNGQLVDQIRRTGGCAEPVRMSGRAVTVSRATGEIIESYVAADEPAGHLLLACGNRRESRCPPCSARYKGDAARIVAAGLAGDERADVPVSVASHPRLFVTLTAPSFGQVHSHVERRGRIAPCRVRRKAGLCPHGRAAWCAARHGVGDPRIGQPLCQACFDYEGAILWNACSSELWRRTITYLPRQLARLSGRTFADCTATARVSFAKVAEFQARGLVHFHAVIRFDGPDGAGSQAPAWATAELLDAAFRAAVAQATVPMPDGLGGVRSMSWGKQIDSRAIGVSRADGAAGITERAVAAYIAKYATKGAEVAGGADSRINDPDSIAELPVTPHARRLMATAWALGSDPAHRGLHLRGWAHMLGFRGHFLTKTAHYSLTFASLKGSRAAHRAALDARRLGLPEGDTTLVIRSFAFAGSGWSPEQAELARVVRDELAARRAARWGPPPSAERAA